MAEFFGALADEHIEFMKRQAIFFVATAIADRWINRSPRGGDCFRVLAPK